MQHGKIKTPEDSNTSTALDRRSEAKNKMIEEDHSVFQNIIVAAGGRCTIDLDKIPKYELTQSPTSLTLCEVFVAFSYKLYVSCNFSGFPLGPYTASRGVHTGTLLKTATSAVRSP